MASESDRVVLLGEDAEGAPHPVQRQSKRTALGLGLGAIAAAALWRSGVGSVAPRVVSVGGIVSAELLLPTLKTVCEDAAVGALVHWPHVFDDVNWEGDCKDSATSNCEDRLIGKYIGDYFDAFLSTKVTAKEKPAIPTSTREKMQWKDRVVTAMQEYAKTLQKVNAAGKEVLLMNALQVPDEFNGVKICEQIILHRPIVATPLDGCRPNYESYAEVGERLKTTVPSKVDFEKKLDTFDSKNDNFPAELSSETNRSIESCRRLLRHSVGADWVESSLVALDVRACLRSGGEDQPKFSRSWVSNCIPSNQIGYPGYVFDFLTKYGIPGEDCVPNYGSLAKGHCPTLCESGASLAGHLKRPESSYTVLFKEKGAAQFEDLKLEMHATAKQHIYNDGPIVGLIRQTQELAACARDDRIVYPDNCMKADADWDNEFTDMHSVVVHGWGSEGGTDYYRAVTSFQEDDHEARIATCAFKFFVIPQTKKGFASSDYDTRLQAIKAEARCPRGVGFCNANEGYTDTEDCDGDGVLDHYCYQAGEGETPSYEAFISSRSECNTVEKSCRRSVLPGTQFGCQRPLGWCMFGERYRRDVDCDGDGHFDHVCEKEGHTGFIASHSKCIDTWSDGVTGEKCDPQKLLQDQDVSIQYKLVADYGGCVQQTSQQCFASHDDWPNLKYPVGVCQFHVEWTQPVASGSGEAGCDTKPESPNSTLYLEVVQMEIERAVFNSNGYLSGERLQVDGVNTQSTLNPNTGRLNAEFVQVKDKAVIQWTTDQNTEKTGWLVCLRLKKKIPTRPEFHKATCSEIGDDIWSMYFTVENPNIVVPVECDMTKCNKATVAAMEDELYTFPRTTNICDAGWQASKSSKFDVSFKPAETESEATYEVLL